MLLFLLIGFLIFILLVLFSLRIYLRWNFNYWTERNVNGPPPQVINGTFPKTKKGECNLIEELHEIYMQYKLSERYVGVFSSRKPKLFVIDPQLAAEILTKHFTHFHDNESSQWTSPKVEQMRLCSPFVSIGDAWKERRGELVPAITINRIRHFNDIMNDCSRKLVAFIRKHCLNKRTKVKKLSQRFTTEFIANFIWGIEGNAFVTTTNKSTIHQMSKSIIEQSLACVRYYGRTADWPWLRKFQPVRFFPLKCDRFFKQLTDDAIRLRLTNGKQRRTDVIDHLHQIKTKKCLNDIQIAGHCTTVLIDGFETASIVIAHCLLLLARDKRVQEKLRNELKMLTLTSFDFDALMQLPYLDQCIQETLRLFPPLPTLFKLCTSPITLDNGKLSLNINDVVYISAYSFHYDPDYYEQPQTFCPERFNPEFGGIEKYRSLGVFLPFGDGPRMCLGMKLGLAEVKYAIAAIIQQFHIDCSPTIRRDNKLAVDSFLLSLDGGIELLFKEL